MKRGFTLLEMLIVIAIIAIVAAMVAMALAGAAEQARADRTRAIINKLDALIGERWESYRTRAVPIRVPPTDPRTAAAIRLNAMRELMRMELPDRITDVTSAAVILPSPPSLWRGYRRKALPGWSASHQGAECLYMILSAMKDGDKSALDYFTSDEIGDVDEDGMKEILDGWGNPIEFLRWAPGYHTAPVTMQVNDPAKAPDPFDPVKVDTRGAYALRPLIFSAGRDKEYDVNIEGGLNYSTTTPPNDPYFRSATPSQAGDVGDANGNGTQEWPDNITNHWKG